MSKKIYTYKEASSEKVYSVSFTVDGVAHHLEAQCYTDDESIMDLPATWDVTDRARGDMMVDSRGHREEMMFDTAFCELAEEIKKDFPGLEICFDYADQAFVQA